MSSTLSVNLGLINVPFLITYMSFEEILFKSIDDEKLVNHELGEI